MKISKNMVMMFQFNDEEIMNLRECAKILQKIASEIENHKDTRFLVNTESMMWFNEIYTYIDTIEDYVELMEAE